MTLPTLIAKYQQKAIDSQFKRVYSNMYNALRMVKAKNGEIPQCYYRAGAIGADTNETAECEMFYKEVMTQLKVVKTCEGNAYSGGCIPKYDGVDTIKEYEDTTKIIGCSGYQQSHILNRNFAYVLNDGTIIFLYDALPGWGSVMAIDVNGKKGPNKWGHDVFSLAWREKSNDVGLTATCSLVQDGGRVPDDLLMNVQK